MPDRGQRFPEEMFLYGGKPSDVESALGMVFEEIPELRPVKDAQAHMRACLNRMTHFTQDPGLQSDKVTGKNKVNDLPLAVRQHFVADGHAGQRGKQLWCV